MNKLEFTNKVIDNLNDSIHEDGKVVLAKFIELTNKLYEDISYISCCTELRADKKLSFKDWKYNRGMRHLSGHTYKDNDGALYDVDELEKMYQNYLNL